MFLPPLLAVSLLVPAAPVPQVTAHAGAAVSLTVTFPLKEVLLNRAAPNRLTLYTPWGGAAGAPSGAVHTQPEFKSYFGSLRPLLLRVPVPPNVRPGLYAARLSGPLFVCNTKAAICVRRDLNLAVNVRVMPASETVLSASLPLTDRVVEGRR
ncbi:hypothetical protein [Deinococcus puniceus]|uniref:hypothetical protein n=1 Tax=Deinococcus puniceus TaxID=1182568 RepID=UPI0007C8BB7F|nr:hypothetical protein [Deinococcus puniceus]